MSSTMKHFSPFANSTWMVLSFLASGLEGDGSFCLCASKRGLSLKVAGVKVAHGTDAHALCADFGRYMEQRRAVIDALEAKLAHIKEKAKKR
jgi:hypothetical protein